jgi:hypothetical protein
VADQAEWAVRGRLDSRQAGRALASDSLALREGQLSELPSGRRYFEERRIRASVDNELSLWLDETCRQVATDLMKQASDFRASSLPPREAAGSPIEVVLNWAFLLPNSASAAFRARIDQVNENYTQRGLVFELSGPWPPYRFVPPLSMGAAP